MLSIFNFLFPIRSNRDALILRIGHGDSAAEFPSGHVCQMPFQEAVAGPIDAPGTWIVYCSVSKRYAKLVNLCEFGKQID